MAKTYLVQVEGVVSEDALARLRAGLVLKDGPTLPAEAREVAAPDWLWPRDPPIRVRQTVPDAWLEIVIREGRNRQVRRMVAAVGLPCLRLIRVAVGEWRLEGLVPGAWREVPVPEALAGRPGKVPGPLARRPPGRGPARPKSSRNP